VIRDLSLTATVALDPRELRWRFSRASGPGGQGVNTTDSRVELTVDVAGSSSIATLPSGQRDRLLRRLGPRLVNGCLTVVAAERRSQLRNRDAATARTLDLLRRALEPDPPTRRATRPTAGSRRRRAESKIRRSRVKQTRRRPPP
jgi:ribosome-associated protein